MSCQSLQAIHQEIVTRQAKLLASVKNECLRMVDRSGDKALLSPDMSRQSPYRVTRFSANGEPWGHTCYPSILAAIKDVACEGYTPTV